MKTTLTERATTTGGLSFLSPPGSLRPILTDPEVAEWERTRAAIRDDLEPFIRTHGTLRRAVETEANAAKGL